MNIISQWFINSIGQSTKEINHTVTGMCDGDPITTPYVVAVVNKHPDVEITVEDGKTYLLTGAKNPFMFLKLVNMKLPKYYGATTGHSRSDFIYDRVQPTDNTATLLQALAQRFLKIRELANAEMPVNGNAVEAAANLAIDQLNPLFNRNSSMWKNKDLIQRILKHISEDNLVLSGIVDITDSTVADSIYMNWVLFEDMLRANLVDDIHFINRCSTMKESKCISSIMEHLDRLLFSSPKMAESFHFFCQQVLKTLAYAEYFYSKFWNVPQSQLDELSKFLGSFVTKFNKVHRIETDMNIVIIVNGWYEIEERIYWLRRKIEHRRTEQWLRFQEYIPTADTAFTHGECNKQVTRRPVLLPITREENVEIQSCKPKGIIRL